MSTRTSSDNPYLSRGASILGHIPMPDRNTILRQIDPRRIDEIVGMDVTKDPQGTTYMLEFSDNRRDHFRIEDTGTIDPYTSSTRSGTIHGTLTTAMDYAELRKLMSKSMNLSSTGSGWTLAPPPDDQTEKPKPKPKPKKKIKPTVSFDSVIMPKKKKLAIIDALEQVNKHDLIFKTWGFEEVFEKGTAISMLFYGEPGTGKTLMAQAIADRLEKKLKTISTAEIESSEPGAAERNIKAFFEQTKDDTVLLFDECDSLIYDRSVVGAILAAQVNQLLSCLEYYKGIVIFTTNRLGVLDEAFNRRLSLKLEFEMPSVKERIDIWKRMFPKKAPLAKKINWERLAAVPITGGYIKNVVLRAARLTAARKLGKITEDILIDSLREEMRSMEEFDNAKIYGPQLVGGGYVLRRS